MASPNNAFLHHRVRSLFAKGIFREVNTGDTFNGQNLTTRYYKS
ncbi:hypothetical protein [Paenibacillus macquariensis]|nr:hypothetical protein [Paenibacillus macquariensis]